MKREKLKVVKIGGKLIEDEKKLQDFLLDFSALEGLKILVHGGGNMATEMAQKLGHKSEMINGRRITDENSLKVILMVYAGLINKKIVAKLQALNCNSIGLCGADGNSIISKKREVGTIDFGFVGDVSQVNAGFISSILKLGIVPVFSAISCTLEGELLNTNGDSIASEIAKAMSQDFITELWYLFEKKGVLADVNDETTVIQHIDKKKYLELLQQNIINEGMLPKLQSCFEALENGVHKVCLGDSKLLGNSSVYTQIVV